MINVKNLKKDYVQGDYIVSALHNVTLEIKEGEFVAIMGASGSGKSTFMNILGCLDIPSGGVYEFEGKGIHTLDSDELSSVRLKKIGFVFQNFNLLPRATALRNVELPMIYAKVPRKERLIRSKQLLKMVGLEGREHHLPRQLSGGQQQRVAIARSLSNNPKLILADEPTGNLDSHMSEEIIQLFKDLNERFNITIILITHEPDIAESASRKIIFKDGDVVSDTSTNSTQIISSNIF